MQPRTVPHGTSRHGRTHIRDRPLRQLPVPLILYLLDLPLAIEMDSNNTANSLLLPNPLDDIPGLQIHQDRIPRILDTMMLSLNLTERTLQPIPLSLVLLAALSDSERVLEGRIVAPKSEFLQRWTAGEEVEDGGDDCLLLRGEGDAGGSGDVCVFDVEGGGGLRWDFWDGFSFRGLG